MQRRGAVLNCSQIVRLSACVHTAHICSTYMQIISEFAALCDLEKRMSGEKVFRRTALVLSHVIFANMRAVTFRDFQRNIFFNGCPSKQLTTPPASHFSFYSVARKERCVVAFPFCVSSMPLPPKSPSTRGLLPSSLPCFLPPFLRSFFSPFLSSKVVKRERPTRTQTL